METAISLHSGLVGEPGGRFVYQGLGEAVKEHYVNEAMSLWDLCEGNMKGGILYWDLCKLRQTCQGRLGKGASLSLYRLRERYLEGGFLY
jgi:uncharacterized protein (UPF0179 family)